MIRDVITIVNCYFMFMFTSRKRQNVIKAEVSGQKVELSKDNVMYEAVRGSNGI